MYQFTINIEDAHAGLWHKLAAIYHTTGVTPLTDLVDKYLPTPPQPIVPKVDNVGTSLSLYENLKRTCTCSQCWSHLVHSDRIPWVRQGKPGNYYLNNVKHGSFTPMKTCKFHATLQKHDISGYIYESALTVKEQAVIHRAKLEQEKQRLENEKVKYDNLKAKAEAEKHQAITAQQLESTNSIIVARREKDKAALLKLIKDKRFELKERETWYLDYLQGHYRQDDDHDRALEIEKEKAELKTEIREAEKRLGSMKDVIVKTVKTTPRKSKAQAIEDALNDHEDRPKGRSKGRANRR
jgi:hypothetical protein